MYFDTIHFSSSYSTAVSVRVQQYWGTCSSLLDTGRQNSPLTSFYRHLVDSPLGLLTTAFPHARHGFQIMTRYVSVQETSLLDAWTTSDGPICQSISHSNLALTCEKDPRNLNSQNSWYAVCCGEHQIDKWYPVGKQPSGSMMIGWRFEGFLVK